MKVVHIITRLILGGAQENTLQTCENQHHLHGDEVTLITGPLTGPEGSLQARASQAGFRFEILPSLVRSIHPWSDWKACQTLTRRLKELQPDIVHTHSSKAGILGRLAARRANLPVVHTIHGASFHYGQSPLAYHTYVGLEKLAARWTDRFICVADDMAQEYLQAGISEPDRYVTIYSGFDVDPYLTARATHRQTMRNALGIADDEIIVGKIGRLFHLKGHEFVLQAAPRIIAANPKVRFLFVGDGILRAKYEQEIAAAGLSDHFLFSGLVPPDQIPELIAAMDIVVHTSQWEGLARVLPQALLAGAPVISYDVGGAREVVIPEKTGYLLPRDNVDSLVESVLELAGNPEKRVRFAAAGRELCQQRFRHQTMSTQIQQVYEEVLSSRKQGRPLPAR